MAHDLHYRAYIASYGEQMQELFRVAMISAVKNADVD
jgi:hypothetical protein